jgi:hypothetical protein
MPGWSGTKDLHLYGKAKDAEFQVVVTNDAKQMNRKLEVEAIASSGLHRIQYPHRQDGLVGLGLAMATVCASLPSVLRELAGADGQRLVILKGIDPGRDHRYGVRDPAIDPPKFWPQQGPARPTRRGTAASWTRSSVYIRPAFYGETLLSCLAVDALSQKVCMPVVPGILLDHVNQHPAQRIPLTATHPASIES